MRKAPKDIDDYFSAFPTEIQTVLQKIRSAIRKAAPQAEEAISYQIPTFRIDGKNMIYFAAFKNHVSIYPAPRGVEEFEADMAKYKGGKGTVQFPLDEKIDYGLITRIVKFRTKEKT
ncbi:MAG: iron chaperone [Blastocatellia bacterium]